MNEQVPSKEQCREQFEMWAENLGLCMDELFMSSHGVPDNPFEDRDTKNFYAAWLAAWEAREALHSAHEPEEGCAKCSNVAPIAKVTVWAHLPPSVELYAPGLPPGEHDLYPSASSPLLHGVPRDRAIWICSICNGWNNVRDKFCTHTHAANADGGSPVNMLVNASPQPPAGEPPAEREQFNPPWRAEGFAIYDRSNNLVVHVGITGNRSFSGEKLERMAQMIADVVNRAAQPPVPEPHVIKQIEHALQDNPAGISREMSDYIRGCISDYRHALTKEPSRDLLAYGYAPGNYMSNCLSCGQNMQDVDKRCRTCKPCAEKKMSAALGESA
jgi:hypothetical protein